MKTVEIQGVSVPALGLGTWQMSRAECRLAVEHALTTGYRHIDTAQMYGNESDVGAALRASDVPREQLWVTTKLGMDSLGANAVRRSTEESLQRLGTDYVDLLLIHWPSPSVPLEETLRAMSELREQRQIRQIGVSNFTPTLVDQARALAPVFCNQVEYHPFLSQQKLLRQAQAHDILLTAYSPLAQARVAREGILSQIGERHRKTPAQVALRWLLQQDKVAAIPKAARPEHIRSNFDIFDFELDAEDMQRIEGLSRGERLINPSWAPRWER